MEKRYQLDHLDCANCAMKIENKISKVKGVNEASVDFVQKRMLVDFDDLAIEQKVLSLVKDIEPDVTITEIKAQKQSTSTSKQSASQQDDCCGHHHEHDMHEDHEHEEGSCCCGHHHEQEEHEDHHHEQGCQCGHEHMEHEERVLVGAQKVYVEGLDCANCAMKIEDYVKKMEGIVDASLNFSTGILFINTEATANQNEIIERVMQVIPTLEDGVRVSKEQEQEEKRSRVFSLKENYRLYIGMIIFAVAIFLENQPYSVWLFLLAYVFAGGKVVYTACRNILRGEVFDENFLMSVATIGAFAVNSYEEAVAVMIFYEIGEMFQSMAVKRSRKSISSLMNIRAEYANKIVEDKEIKVTPESLEIGDILLIKPGERVPLDGVIIEGNSSLDTSALTGESIPREVKPGDEVLAGVVNVNGVLKLTVSKVYGESTVARILELVENASSKKAPMEKFITRFAKIYTPVVVFLAIAVAVLPMLFIEGAVFQEWLYRALTFLVVSCPCALVISVPLGMFAGIGAASRQGVLIKGGNYLEALQHVDTVVFDKTGTLTKGVFAVTKIAAKKGTEEDVLMLAAYGEFYSNHPIAASIRNAYQGEVDASLLQAYEEVAGNGIRVLYQEKELLIGNHILMETNHIPYDQAEEIGTIMHIAYDQVYIGYVLIADEIKETSKQAIQSLKMQGIRKCVMLSGDRQAVGDYVAKELGLDEVHMQLLPVDKVEQVERLLQEESDQHKLAFVGDGINDAPVLARADVGIAMGGIGSDAAIEAADVVLMRDDPQAIAVAMQIAKKTTRILWQNIVFSLGIKVIILVLTIFGLSNMWMGVFADVGVTLLAVLNSMRAMRSN